LCVFRKSLHPVTIKDFTPYVGKIKGQTAGDVNRVLPALKDKAEPKTIEDNLITNT
jgi:peptidyl-prolyl cis-trans isomerase D